jgi:amino acid transporter, AAT family
MTQDTEFERGLHHKLTAGRMAMVAIGSTIGTGLLLGSGAAVHIAGPAIVLTYVIGAFLAWIVTNALGELSSAHPAAGSFGVYAELYLNPWAGFVASYGYWYGVVLSIGAELVAASTYCKYWFTTVPGIVWTVI